MYVVITAREAPDYARSLYSFTAQPEAVEESVTENHGEKAAHTNSQHTCLRFPNLV